MRLVLVVLGATVIAMAKVRSLLVVLLLPLIAITAVATVKLWPDHRRHDAPASLGVAMPQVNAKVTKVVSGPCPNDPSGGICTTLAFDLTSGADKGKSATAPTQVGPGTPRFAVGDKIVLGRSDDQQGTVAYYVSDYERKTELGWLALAFAIGVVVIGRWRGIGAVAGLGFTWLVVSNFLLPSMLEGKSPVALAVTAAALIVFVVLYLAHGFNSRTTIALIGTLIGLGLTGLLANYSVSFAHVTGLSSDDVTSVQTWAGQVNIRGLLIAGIVIGSLGVLNDVTVAQASSVWEIHGANPSTSRRELYKSGMRVGRDHLASTVYTLVLAYVGAALPLFLIFAIANRTWSDVAGSDVVSEEIVRAIAGGIGLILAVPITTALAAFICSRPTAPPEFVPATVDVSPSEHSDVDEREMEMSTVGRDTGEHSGLIDPEAYPPQPKKRRWVGRANSEFNRKMGRRERKFWNEG